MSVEAPHLNAGTVRLRPHGEHDVPGILDQCTDPQTQAWTTVPDPYTRADAEQFLHLVREQWRAQSRFELAIADPASDEFLGTVGVTPDGHGQAELSFGLRRAARGRGVMSAAIRRVAEWSFDADGLDVEVLHWRAFVGNWASRRAAWATGFRVEGTVRALCHTREGRYDSWIGSLRRGDLMRPRTPWLEPPTITGTPCNLRPFSQSDIPHILEAFQDADLYHWIGDVPHPYTPAHALAYLHRIADEAASGSAVYVAAADLATNDCVGGFGLLDIDREPGCADIGYWVHPAARGTGIATEAVRLLVRHALIEVSDGGLGLHRIGLRAARGNGASQRVADKAGFTRVGVERRAKRLGDLTYDDLLTYDLVASDPVTSDLSASGPSDEDPGTGDPDTGDPDTGDPDTENPATDW